MNIVSNNIIQKVIFKRNDWLKGYPCSKMWYELCDKISQPIRYSINDQIFAKIEIDFRNIQR